MSLRRVLTIALFLAPLAALTVKAADSTIMELVQTIPLKGKPGKLDHLTVDNKGERLLLANKVNNTLDVVDLKAGQLLKQISEQSGVQGVAFAPDLECVYAALGTGGFNPLISGFNGDDIAVEAVKNKTMIATVAQPANRITPTSAIKLECLRVIGALLLG